MEVEYFCLVLVRILIVRYPSYLNLQWNIGLICIAYMPVSCSVFDCNEPHLAVHSAAHKPPPSRSASSSTSPSIHPLTIVTITLLQCYHEKASRVKYIDNLDRLSAKLTPSVHFGPLFKYYLYIQFQSHLALL